MRLTQTDLINFTRKAKVQHNEVFSMLLQLRNEIRANMQSQTEMVDTYWFVREISRLADDLRKEADALNEKIIAPLVCTQWALESTTGQPIRGDVAVGSPTIKTGMKVPAKDTPEFLQLLKYFGDIKPEFIKMDMLRLHYPTLTAYVAGLTAEGKNPPPGIKPDETYPIPGLTVRLRPGTRNPLDSDNSRTAKESNG